MRLLKLDHNSESVMSTIFVGDDVPPYAILSHTWGADTEEVSLKDLVEGTGIDKAGYDKIKFCGEQAKHDNLQYFWVDTCCIDKSNSVELQEAINSMFRWYQNAAKCYVYLVDVSHPPSDAAKTKLNPIPWEAAFCRSRWFSRGWTLQELLAPTFVEFFSQERTLLGDKRSLERHIHNATRIPIKALRGCPLSQFSVDDRLQWAQFRETTRGEDWAYSLLGILNIFIPLIYGEGRVNAVTRLYAEMSEASRRLQTLPKNLPYIKDAPLSMITTDEKVYKTVLDRVIFLYPGHESILKDLLGSLVVLQTPLPVHSLCRLIKLPEVEVLHLLDNLHAILHIPDDLTEPLRVHDVSFCTYICEERLCGNPSLLVELKQMHETLALACITIMAEPFKQDVSGAEYTAALSPSESNNLVERFLPLGVQYAFNNWVQHLQKSHTRIKIDGPAISFLKAHLLHWLEAMGWMQRITEAIDMIVSLRSTVHASACDTLGCSKVCIYLKDIERFTLYFQEGILQAPLQIYHSTSLFISSDSPVNMQVEKCVPRWVQRLPKVDEHLRSPIALTSASQVVGMAFVPGGRRLVSASDDGTIKVWDVFTGELLSERVLQSPPIPILKVKFAANCKLLASVELSGNLTFWDISSGQNIRKYQYSGLTKRGSDHLVFSPDGKRLALPVFVNNDFYIRLVDIENRSEPKKYLTKEYPAPAAFSPDSRQFAFFINARLLMWDMASKKGPKTLWKPPPRFPAYEFTFRAAAFSPDGKQLATIGSWVPFSNPKRLNLERRVRAIDKQLTNPAFYADFAAFSPNCSQFALLGGERGVTLWDLESGDVERLSIPNLVPKNFKGIGEEFMLFSPDNMQLAAYSHKISPKTIIVWNIKERNEHETFVGHGDKVTVIELSPNGKQLASASRDMMIKLWDPYSGKETKRLSGHNGSITAMAFSPDGMNLGTASFDDTIRFWNTLSGNEVAKLSRYGRSTNTMAFSPNGAQLLWASSEGGVRLCNIPWGRSQKYGAREIFQLSKRLKKLEGLPGSVTTVAFSVDGEQQASGSEGGTVRLWNTASKKSTLLNVHGARISAVAFSPDAQQLAVASTNRVVTLWEIMSGLQLRKIELLAPISSLKLSSDGQIMETDRGTLDFPDVFLSSQQPGSKPQGNIFFAGEWIYRGSERLLWLPPEYRGLCWVVRGDLVVIGQESGAVTFLKFTMEKGNEAVDRG